MYNKLCKRCWNRNGVKRPKTNEIIEEKNCPLCLGSFSKLEQIGKMIKAELDSNPEISTFSIGTKFPKESENIEETIWENVKLKNARSVKSELNAEIGKWIEKNSNYRFHQNPDVRIIYDPKKNTIEKHVSSLYIYGYYNKLKRMIRQTKKIDSKDESVEGFIEKPVLKLMGGTKVVLHGSGREDIDVLMLGDGRPFVIEIKKPEKRKISEELLKEIEKEINLHSKGKIAIKLKKICDKELVEIIKRAKFDKEYEAIIETEKQITKKDLERIPSEIVIFQRTPRRVSNRRADLVRKRKIKSIKLEIIDNKHLKARILSQSGTYIKEFINGDEGRTKPSISSLLETTAVCKELNVLKIHSEWLDDFW